MDAASAAGLSPDRLLDIWLEAGVRLVQLRAKRLPLGPMVELAARLSAPATAAGAWFVVNDRADVARLIGATGVHVGQDDLAVPDVRRILSQGQIVGLSTHTPAQVDVALGSAVDYVAIGPVFETASKAQADPVIGLEGVRLAALQARGLGIPLVAIGGITLERAPAVFAAGADAVAVIGDLLTTGDPRAVARQWLSQLSK